MVKRQTGPAWVTDDIDIRVLESGDVQIGILCSRTIPEAWEHMDTCDHHIAGTQQSFTDGDAAFTGEIFREAVAKREVSLKVNDINFNAAQNPNTIDCFRKSLKQQTAV